MDDGLCECGCGDPAPIATRTNSSRGNVKGKPQRYKPGHHYNGSHKKLLPFADRFARFVFCHGDPDACWIWTGTRRQDYGLVKISGKLAGAHVETYRLFKGELPEGKPIVRHTCDQPACCNPAHLIPGTHAENMQDKVERGRCNNGRPGKENLK